MTVFKSSNISLDIKSTKNDIGDVGVKFYSEDINTTALVIRITKDNEFFNLNEQNYEPKINLFMGDGSIFLDQSVEMIDAENGLVRYLLKDKVKHAGQVKVKVLLKKADESIHVADFKFEVIDSELDKAVAKEIDVDILSDAFERFALKYPERVRGKAFTFDDFTEEQLESLKGKDGTVSFEELTPEQKLFLKGEKGDTGPKGDTGAKGDIGPKGKDGSVVTINPETKVWQIDGSDTEILAIPKEPKDPEKATIDNIEGLKEKIDLIDKAKPEAVAESKEYTDQKIADLIDSAPESMNTLRELAEAIQDNKVSESVLQQIGEKLPVAEFNAFKESLSGLYAEKNHSHSMSDIQGLEEKITEHDDKFALKVHTHSISQITGLTTALSEKAEKQHSHPEYQLKSEVQPSVKIWTGTQSEFGSVYPKDDNTLYLIRS
ncbi:BppU family phage baseplate upper protein [Macrococcus caseolyticus]|uniref:BppU family phage baseplate upper protein n=1 Tax=Macrococcoides caseolyticum TaxID=69966 RepID=UPI0024BC5C9D|nr:BppU family phage baseplate upper protein [Macrococcus caseolyticus]MDJ1154513.1 BppU family phage baseplate upper protein [Macrococcus caseolyticus]